MINAVSPVQAGSPGAVGPITTARPNGASDVFLGRSMQSGGSQSALGSSQALNIAHVFNSMTALLDGIKGSSESAKLLRLLIALVILAALLEASQNEGKQGTENLSQLGARSGGRSQFFGVFTSSTTIEIHQSTTNVFFIQGADPGSQQGQAPTAPSGELDVTA